MHCIVEYLVCVFVRDDSYTGTFLSAWMDMDLRKQSPTASATAIGRNILIDCKSVRSPVTQPFTTTHPPFVFSSQATRLSPGHISSISDMSQPSSSSSFQGLFNAALQDYENQTKTKLVQHPLAKKLEACDSVDSITAILQEQAQIFGGFRDDEKIMKSLRSSVDVLYTLFNNTILGEVIGLVVPTTLLIVVSCF